MIPSLPHKCFISHSYKDIENRKQLLAMLPASVEAVVFPPIQVTPDEMVSNSLIESILSCDGLIWLDGGHSQYSFWVAFERDYAVRAGRSVFRFDPATRTLERDTKPPLNLPVFPSYHRAAQKRVSEIIRIMKRERFFDLFLDRDLLPDTSWTDAIDQGIVNRIAAGGYVVVFLSRQTVDSHFVISEITRAYSISPSRVIFAWLDQPFPLPIDFPAPFTQWIVLSREERPGEINLNRVDDLIVMLYWRILQNTQSNELH